MTLAFEAWLPAWVLVLTRVAGVFLALPVFVNADIPMQVRAIIAVAVAALLLPAVAPAMPPDLTLGRVVGGLVGELAIGELIGLAAGAVLLGAQLAGHLVDQQSGLALGSVFNPMLESESTILEQVWFLLAAALFFALRGHVAIIGALLESFRILPPLTWMPADDCAAYLIELMRLAFDLALRLAGPAVLALVLATIGTGFLARTMPQFNLLSVGFSFKLLIALTAMAATIGVADGLIADALADGLDSLARWLADAAAGAVA